MAPGLNQPYHFHVPIVLKSGSLNLLELSGPVQACNEIALPFTFPIPFLVFFLSYHSLSLIFLPLPLSILRSGTGALSASIAMSVRRLISGT